MFYAIAAGMATVTVMSGQECRSPTILNLGCCFCLGEIGRVHVCRHHHNLQMCLDFLQDKRFCASTSAIGWYLGQDQLHTLCCYYMSWLNFMLFSVLRYHPNFWSRKTFVKIVILMIVILWQKGAVMCECGDQRVLYTFVPWISSNTLSLISYDLEEKCQYSISKTLYSSVPWISSSTLSSLVICPMIWKKNVNIQYLTLYHTSISDVQYPIYLEDAMNLKGVPAHLSYKRWYFDICF